MLGLSLKTGKGFIQGSNVVPITIGSNISSLKAQRQLNRSSEALSTVYERLSSGQRINKASDDAAGLAVSDALRANTKVYTQANRNINDGVSLLQIADSALNELSNILTRQKELATQAANGTYSGRQRKALQSESNALVNEYNRIVQSTSFNGLSVLGGNNKSVVVQSGYGTAESTSVGVTDVLGSAAGDGTFGAGVTTGGASFNGSAVADLNGDGTARYHHHDVKQRKLHPI